MSFPKKVFKKHYAEKPAEGVHGFLIYDYPQKRYVFRVYNRNDFTDYLIRAESIELTINSDNLSLFEKEDEYGKINKLSWSSKYLNRWKEREKRA